MNGIFLAFTSPVLSRDTFNNVRQKSNETAVFELSVEVKERRRDVLEIKLIELVSIPAFQ